MLLMSPDSHEISKRPVRLIKLLLEACKDESVGEHEDGFGILMIH